jgi:hypothetical protein
MPALVLAIACGSSSGGTHGSPSSDAGDDGTARAEVGTGDSGGGSSGGTSDSGAVAEGGGGEAGVDAPAGEAGPAPIAGLRIFYTDLTSGPATGGQAGKGAFVTLYGNGFGASQGASTVTVGGGAADNYPVWTSTKVTMQLGAAAQTGDVVVHVAGKGDSNAVPFTIRSGTIYFVSGTGKDGNAGTFASPWGTIPKAKNSLAAGDIAYVGTSAGDSVSQTTEDASSAYGGALGMSVNDGANAGTATMPKALVVYPGATATIGDPVNLAHGIIVPAITGTFDYWTIAGFTLRGLNEAIELEGSSQGWRIVGNDISCPNGSGESGCVTDGAVNSAPGLAFLGNDVHDAAASVTSVTKYYHAIYFSSNHLELGWNVVRDGKTCRGIQIHDTGGPNNFDISIHDNLIHGTVCDGINLATVDPSQGAVKAFDNVVYDVGTGPDPADGSSSYACIYVANITNTGAAGSGNVEVYDNTLANCGARGTSAGGAISLTAGPVGIVLTDNLVLATSSESYVASDSPATGITGNDNLFFGAGVPPAGSGLTGSINADPAVANATSNDYHLTAGSPAVDTGVPTAAVTDFDGNPRPQGKAYDVGAYELPQ